jgi:hypothetical protein
MVKKVELVQIDSLAKVRRSLEDVRVKETESAVFINEIQLNPVLSSQQLQIKWFKNGQELVSNPEKYSFEQETDSKHVLKSNLTINNTNIDNDPAEYSCQLYLNNEFLDLKQTSAKLHVKESEPKLIKELPSSLVLTEGDSLHLECQISKPGLSVEWLKDNQPLKPLSTLTTKTQDQQYTLDRDNVDVKQSGKYKLVYKNLISTECKVTIKPTQLVVTIPLSETITVRESEKALLFCEFNRNVADNNPNNVKLEWYKNGKRLYFSNKSLKYQLNLSQNKCELVVRDCAIGEDDANYELRVCDQADDSCLLSVRTQLIVKPLGVKITDGLANTAVIEGDNAKLNFRVSKPANCECEWFFMKKFPSEPVNPSAFDRALLSDTNLFCKLDPTLSTFNANNNSYTLVMPDAQIDQVILILIN